MPDHLPARTRSALEAVADDTERLQAAIRTRTETATTPDGWITVAVSADGTVHDWHISGADGHINQLVTSLLDLIDKAHTAAQQAIRTELDEISDRAEIRAAADAARDSLARATASSSVPSGDDYDYDYHRPSRIAAD